MTTAPTTITSTVEAVAETEVPAAPGRLADYVTLTKARLSTMVVMTAAAGFVVASPSTVSWLPLVWAIVGTALAAASAAVLNQAWETRRDGLMVRTQGRPLPAGRLGVRHAVVVGVLLGYLGTALLAVTTNWLAAGLALGNILLYVLVYTPLKPRTTLNTLVGAVCGAVPPMIGWAAATGTLAPGAWILAAILFVWQLPHFMALAWMYRDDYRRGGYRMLPVLDAPGHLTGQVIVLTSATLVPLSLLLMLAGYAGFGYAAIAFVLGVAMTAVSLLMAARPGTERARAVFLASIAYLPLLTIAMVVDRGSPRPATPLELERSATTDLGTFAEGAGATGVSGVAPVAVAADRRDLLAGADLAR